MFPNEEIKIIYAEFKVDRCYLYQNLTDTDSTSIFFVFVCDLKSSINERKSRDIILKVMIKSKKYSKDLIYQTMFGINLAFRIKN